MHHISIGLNKVYTAGRTLVFLCFLNFSCGCDRHDSNSVFSTAGNHLQKIGDQLQQAAPDTAHLSSQAWEQVQRIFALEYKVLSLPIEISQEKTQNTLNELGNQAWDCFSILPRDEFLVVTCKRRTPAVLRYLNYVPVF